MRKSTIATVLFSAASCSMAADAVGALRSVQEGVTVASASGVSQSMAGLPLTATSRTLVVKGSRATVMLAEDCVITLKANQINSFDSKFVCSEQVTAPSELAAPYRLALAPDRGVLVGGAGSASGLTRVLVIGGLVAGAVVVNEVTTNDLSSN